MANKLIFPVGFDLAAAVKDAEGEWASKYQSRLSKAIRSKPLTLKVKFDTKELDNLSDVQKRLAKIKLAPVTPETKGAISALVKELKNLEKILKNIDELNKKVGRSGNNITSRDALAEQRLARAAQARAKAASEQKKLAIQEEKLAQAKLKTAAAEQKLASAAGRTNSAFRSQNGYLSRLIKRLGVYFSLYTVANFVKRIREVTAEFELQRVSLASIIQDTQKANELFSRIKAFAVKSPFEIKDLVSYVKQLSAYKIKTDDLFDTTKRLADVSAGLGVSMDRIILAYGQVRAASVLRGSELRQFYEAGIPLVELLAQKFTQLRGEVVTTADVFDLVSKRAVPFEMVKEIFEDMTNAGGMFYKMQEKQSETLAGMWSNLKDAYSIMLDEIGRSDSVNSGMRGLIETTKGLLDHFQGIANAIEQVVVAMLLYRKAANTTAVSVKKQIFAEKALEAKRISALAVGRALTREELNRIVAIRKLNAAEYQRLITEGKLSSMQLVRLARAARTNAAIEEGILLSKKMTAEQVAAIATASKGRYAWGMLRASILGFGASVQRAFLSFGSTLSAFWPFALISAAISLFSEFKRSSENLAAALEKNKKSFEDYAMTLTRIENAYLAASKAAKDAAEAGGEFVAASYGDKLKQLQEMIKLLDNLGLKNVIDLSVVNEGNIDKIFSAWSDKLKEINALTEEWGRIVAEKATAFEANILGWSIAGENLSEDMKDLRRELNKITMDKSVEEKIEKMRVFLDSASLKSEKLYKKLTDAVGEDAKLALSEKRRNESEIQYLDRILRNYGKISTILYGIGNTDFSPISTGGLEEAVEEILHELDGLRGKLEKTEPLAAKMTIDRIFLQNEWDKSLEELVIRAMNKKWDLKIPVNFVMENADETTRGIKSIISNEFPSLFTDEELKNMSNATAIVEAIRKKREEARKEMEKAAELQNNMTGSAEKYGEIVAEINKQIAQEEAKPVTDRDEALVKNLHKRLVDMQEQNKEYEREIKQLQEDAKKAYEEADAAYNRLASAPLSTVAKDFVGAFPDLLSDAEKSVTDADYSVKLHITEEDVQGIKDIGDLYEWWVQSNKKLEETTKSIAMTHVSDAAIEKEKAELAERQAKAAADLETINKRLEESRYQETMATYNQLLYRRSIATTAEDLAKAQKEIDNFLASCNDNLFVGLVLRKQELELTMAQKKTSGELANEQIESYKEQEKKMKELLDSVGERYNFKMPDTGKKKGGGEDPWVMLMKNRMKFMQDFQKGVEDLSKFMRGENALGQERDIMLFRGKSLDIDVKGLEGTQKELVDWYEGAIAEVSKKIAKLGGKMWEGLGVQAILAKDTKSRTIKAYQELLQELFNQETDFQTAKLKEQLQQELDRIADEVSKTKEAKEFYDKILKLTGDTELSADFAVKIYGETGEGLKSKFIKQIETAFKGVDISGAINRELERIDFGALREKLAELPEEQRKSAEKIVRLGESDVAKVVELGTKIIMEYDEIAQKRVDIEQAASEKIRQLREAEAAFLSSAASAEDKAAYSRRTETAISGVQSEMRIELMKLSDTYIRFFSAIHSVTRKEADTLRTDLRQALFQAFQDGAMSADELRRELNAIDNQFEKLINDAGGFGTYLQSGFDGVIRRMREMADEALAVAAAISKMDSPDQISEGQKSFIDDILGKFGNESTGKSFADLFSFANGDTKQMAANLGEAAGNMGDMAGEAAGALSIVDKIIQGVNSTITGIADIRDQLNSMRSDTRQLEGGFWDAFEYVEEFNKYAYQGWERLKSGDVVGAAVSTVQSVISIFGVRHRQKVKRLNKEIKRQQEIIDDLSNAYERLEKVSESLFGNEYIENYAEQQKNLRAQINATQKQLDAELAKGKSTDDDKVRDYREKLYELNNELEDLQSKLGEQFLGADVAGAARDFVQSWLEAYKEFDDTSEAIEETMAGMMENLMSEAVFGGIAKKVLEPMYDYVNNLDAGAFSLDSTWQQIYDLQNKAQEEMNKGLSVGAGYLQQMGMLTRDMGGDLTGISKEISEASEESILGLAAGINTQNYYISHIDSTVSQIFVLMQGGGASFDSGERMADLVTVQNQHLSYLPSIAQNTAGIVTRAERAAAACESIAENIGRVVRPNGVKGSYRLNASLN